jgi:DNA-binding LacI/PurR family transcriptional regulator
MNPPPDEAAAAEAQMPRSLPKPGEHKTITMATIAKAAGVSQGAISSLLNDRDYGIRVSDRTRDRVFKVCRELGYIPNDLRAVVRMYPHLGDVCILFPAGAHDPALHPATARFLSGAAEASPFAGRPVTFCRFDPAGDFLEFPDSAPHPVKAGIASKFILCGHPNSSLAHAIIRRGFPVVVVGSELPIPGVTNLLADFAAAGRLGIEHLHALGHRRILITPGPFGTSDRALIELNRGLKAGADAVGLPIDASMLVYGDLNFETGWNAVDAALARDPKPTALFCLSDETAAGAIARAAAKGIKPSALSILGCGDDPLARLTQPKLTTLRIPHEELGAHAVREAETRVTADDLSSNRTLLEPVHLVERESVKPPKTA